MSSWTRSVTSRTPRKPDTAAAIIARQDRIPIWSLSYLFIGIIGMGFLFTFFDIGDINISFVQTCVDIVPKCVPTTATSFLGLPVLTNLVGYMLGALVFSPLADRYGRRDLLVMTMVITSLGSLYTTLVTDYNNFILARLITGIGIGADLALVNTYINEVAPRNGRVKYTALIFLLGQTGSATGVFLGFLLTTPAAPFPIGIPFALASANFMFGWRVIYGIGASLAIFGLLLRVNMPESPRWLISQGRVSEAERIVEQMEQRALMYLAELPPVEMALPVQTASKRAGYAEIFGNALYFKRTILLLVIWLLGYIAVYATVAGTASIQVALGYPLSQAGLIASVGSLGGFICAFIAYRWGESLERKYWLLIAAVIALVGGVIFTLGGRENLPLAFVGVIIDGVGLYLWLPILYTWSAEHYPTRARATGFALVDGLGHVGGGIGAIYILFLVNRLGPFFTYLSLNACLLAAAYLAIFGARTSRKRLDEVSP